MFSDSFISEWHACLNASEKCVIVVHEYPDLDAVGSALALKMALDAQGFNAMIWIPEPLNQQFDFLPGKELVTRKLPKKPDFDCVIFLDSSHKERVAQHEKLDPILINAQCINLDHHCDNSLYADLNLLLEISSVGEMLALFFKKLGWSINQDMAVCLYSAICFDTGRFAYSNTTSQTMHVVADLLDTGFDPNQIYQHMYENKTKASFKLLKVALDNLIVSDAGYAYTTIPLSVPKAAFKLVDFIRQLRGIDVFMVIQAVNTRKVKVNLRSKQHFDVSAFANQFGGGGHVRASGLVFHDTPLDECVTTMTDALDKALASHTTD